MRKSLAPLFNSERMTLICLVGFLTGIGLLAIYASSSIPASQRTGDEFIFLRKQAIVAAVGFIGIFAVGHMPLRWLDRLPLPMAGLALGSLLLLFVPGLGARVGGATRWLELAGFRFQPSELAKLALVLILAKNLSRPRSVISNFRVGILPNVLLLSIFIGLLLLQPDFGTASLLFIVTFLMLFAAGLPRRYIFGSMAVGLAGLIIGILAAPYRIIRLVSYLDPWTEMRGSGFQIIQSYLAFQNGGLLGVGLGESRQKLFFLPEAHTDFILSVIGEELGLVGVLLVCSLFAYLAWLGFRISQRQRTNFHKFLALGLTCMICTQAAVNMGVTLGLLPTKGIPLPFVSNGASSLVVFLAAIAILARLSQEGGINLGESKKPT